ncbi:MAG: hypothetical protein C4293_16935, partial [Nitrospiraceae bacterium]
MPPERATLHTKSGWGHSMSGQPQATGVSAQTPEAVENLSVIGKARVLIVDDEPTMRRLLAQGVRLRMPGVEVEVSDLAETALRRIARIDYDAIISDIKMPGMDGLAMLNEIRSIRPDTPTLLVTGHGECDLVVQALRRGACDFIQKPINWDYFIASLIRALRMRQLCRQLKEQQVALIRHNLALEQTREELRMLAAQLITVQEEERRRLSCELHDGISQKVAALLLQVEALQRQLAPLSDEKGKRLQALRKQAGDLLDELHCLASHLHPSLLDHFGLTAALESYVEDFSKRENIRIRFVHQDLPDFLPGDIATCLYRVTQEALRIIARRARVSSAAIRL